ncbi:MAG TPA: dipeptidase, partial [Candidatus Acidoferrales bacterium]|nr:dipeptidase [Candidatus Acidoferrales bacterium]
MRNFAFGVCGILLAAIPLMMVSAQNRKVSTRARDLQMHSIVIDTHDDTTQRLLDPHFDLGTRHDDGNIDIPRMKEGGLDAIFFSIYIPGTITGPTAVEKALDQIAAVREMARRHPNDVVLAKTAAEVRRAYAEHKIAALMGVEGGHMINDDLSVLDTFAALGVRYMTLTHFINTDWADSSTDKPAHNGLTDFGKRVVERMNRDGIMVDISHVADKTFYDALAVSKAPLIASHSSCRALCDVPRDMTDDMIKALAAKDGVIQINYHVGFLSQEYVDATKVKPEILKHVADEVAQKCSKDDETCQLVMENQLIHKLMLDGTLPKVNWTEIVDHIDHAVKVGGVDHVGLGSDYDGSDMPLGMEDVTHLPQITQALLDRGYSDADIKKILGENTLRVMAEAERVSREM